jgi:pyruvate formate lyase activating enzyme
MNNLSKLIFSLLILFTLLIACLSLPNISAKTDSQEALFYEKLSNKTVQCQLCPRRCVILNGLRGFCGVRENQGGILYTLVYAKPVSLTLNDPVEKKPLFHFLPSSLTFSLATAGCNLRCKFCQNWDISQRLPEEVGYIYLKPPDLIEKVKASGRQIIAFTYTEPTIFYEYMLEVAKLARAQGIRNVMHSNGYINEKPLRALARYLDAANIDLKGFTQDYYAKMSEGSLAPVLESLKILKEERVHLEITNLVLPGHNDDEKSIITMCLWIKDNLGADTPLHFSRFMPMYKLIGLNPTPVETLEKARRIALDCGLKYVYIGNVSGNEAENTYCPKCRKIAIRRVGFTVTEINILEGKCKFCGEGLAGVWG